MRQTNPPTSQELRLGHPKEGATLRETLMQSMGDPCYLSELGDRLDGWSRKQIEQAIGKLEQEGLISIYGRGTRRLYASPRQIPHSLHGLTAATVRALQRLPLKGTTTLDALRSVISNSGAVMDELVLTGLAIRYGSCPAALLLTRRGAAAAATLGDGLRHFEPRPAMNRRTPATGLDLYVSDRLRRKETIEEPVDAALRKDTRAAVVRVVGEIWRKAAKDQGLSGTEVQNRIDPHLEAMGLAPAIGWVGNVLFHYRIPSEIECRAAAAALGLEFEQLAPHIRSAPWTVDQNVGRLRISRG